MGCWSEDARGALESAALHRRLVAGEAFEALSSRNHVISQDVCRDGAAALALVLVKGGVRRDEEGVLAGLELFDEAIRLDRRAKPPKVVVALDLRLVVAERDTFRTPEDLRSLHGSCGVEEAGHRYLDAARGRAAPPAEH